MKKALLLLCVILSVSYSYAQDPELTDNSWFVDFIVADGITYESPIVAGPGINQDNLIFDSSMVYGVIFIEDDSFFADISYDVPNTEFTFTNPAITLPGCNHHCAFAAVYFELLAGDFIEVQFSYEVVTNPDDSKTLTITRSDGDLAVFNNFPPLGINDEEKLNVTLYPNPVSEKLFLTTENTQIETISIFDTSGKKIRVQIDVKDSVDVSFLSKGIYFIEVASETGKAVKKFIKE